MIYFYINCILYVTCYFYQYLIDLILKLDRKPKEIINFDVELL